MDNTSAVAPRTPRRWRFLLAAGGVAVAIAVAVGVGFVIADGSTDDTVAAPAGQLASFQQACNQWRASIESPAPGASWCSAMTGWMSQQVQRGPMTGPMMWEDPDQMLATCQRWTSNATRADADATWCDQMVAWMNTNMGDWDNWMMNGPMMGG